MCFPLPQKVSVPSHLAFSHIHLALSLQFCNLPNAVYSFHSHNAINVPKPKYTQRTLMSKPSTDELLALIKISKLIVNLELFDFVPFVSFCYLYELIV